MAKRPLLALPLLSLTAFVHADTKSFLTRPDVYGDSVVFTAEGDLWLGDIRTQTAKRLTSSTGTETNARFSPDGTKIAFTGTYDGGNDVYVMSVGGGAPKRLTFDPKGALVLGWSGDGKSILFRSRREVGTPQIKRLWSVPVDGGLPKLVPVPQAEFAAMRKDGLLAYVPISNEWANWFRYEAGAADDIWLNDPATGSFTKLTTYKGVDTTPVWCGDDLYFVTEQSGTLNLAKLDVKSKRVTPITKNVENPIRYPGSDGKRVVFEAGPTIAMYEPTSGVVKTLAFDLSSDRIHSREQRVPLAPNVQSAAVGPTGKRVLLEARGQIVSIAVEEGDMRVLENKPGTRAMRPAWAPDGKQVAFVSDRTGENEIWLTDGQGAAPKQLTKGLKANPFSLLWSPDSSTLAVMDRNARMMVVDAKTGVVTVLDQAGFTGSYDSVQPGYAFSPDSKYLAYNRPESNFMFSVQLVELASKKRSQLSANGINSLSPAFSPDGKLFAFLEERDLEPAFSNLTRKYSFDNTLRVTMVPLTADATSPFLPKNDEESAAKPADTKKEDKPAPAAALPLDDVSARRFQPPVPPGRYSKLGWTGGRLILLAPSTPTAPVPAELSAFDIEKKASTTLASGVSGFEISADGKKILVSLPNGAAVIDAAGGAAQLKPISVAPYSLAVDPEKEWGQVLDEAWRIARDFFYDPGMHGVDWAAVRKKYQTQLPLVADRTDLTRLLKDMVSELNSGHAYITNPAPFAGRPAAMGFLGADFERAPQGVRIAKLLRGDDFSLGERSPLLEPGLNVKEGDYILAIAGQPVRADADIYSLLIGLQNQTVAVTVNDKPTLEGSRVVRVKLLGSEDTLRYQDWVRGRMEYVRKNGGPNLGYLHVPDMVEAGVIGFVKGQLPNTLKEGMVYDFRYNGGGFVSSLLLDNIRTKPLIWWQPRSGGTWTREDWANVGYSAALANEYNFSDGELVIESWKMMNLGPVVGKPTGGGEVGSGGGYRLIDGGAIYVPNYAGFVQGKWVIEGTGATPDVEVDQDPAAVMAGRDPQLDKAIALLKERIAKNPIRLPVHPAYPNKARKSG